MPREVFTRRLVALAVIAFASTACAKGEDKKSGTTDETTLQRKAVDAAPPPKPPVGDLPPVSESKCAAGKVAVSAADRFECTADEECVTTCGWGALNWRGHLLLQETCKDGCSSEDTLAKCLESRCTTVAYDGKRVATCNDIAAPEDVCVDDAIAKLANQCKAGEKLVPTWRRFTCKADTDCVTSCMHGALNRTWYDRLGDGCDDGCSSKGMHGECISNRCVAFDRNDERVDSCTNMPGPDEICIPK